jgi:hypothetical protein
MRVEDLREGMRVTYVPNHADNNASHPDCERGVVTSWRESFVKTNGVETARDCTVFVRYGSQQNSKATSLENLVQG